MCHRVLGFAIVMLGCLAVPADSTAQDTAKLVKRAQASFDKGQYDKALNDCNRVLQLDPLSAEAYNLRGRIQQRPGQDRRRPRRLQQGPGDQSCARKGI